ncbi:MAG: hypothetical protein DRN99_09530 [Thermoproteota archaeon]|nr:MAG: hypothetical protein DRN99_09530 [Candidatus Korarchaeota archaeon]
MAAEVTRLLEDLKRRYTQGDVRGGVLVCLRILAYYAKLLYGVEWRADETPREYAEKLVKRISSADLSGVVEMAEIAESLLYQPRKAGIGALMREVSILNEVLEEMLNDVRRRLGC